ncbi:LacI family DNA-binding transcriptional regulator [Oryzibacter oryziterrae]|uniref:LacI family DNA-binding transcriptional regulator n=1 Tax=Oryzibacter oryziterrae TaxID=2766474 RepID=UPI001F226CC4|nr:substrate-binding domain-containing protein [Oryzibacter oryziterrae]
MNLKQLAAELGLSQTTVSRALNGYPEVNAKTKELVLAAAQRHGYRASPAARRLATGKAHALGVVFPMESNVLLDPLYVEFLAGVAETCGQAGFDILVSPTTQAGELSTYRRLAQDGTVDAVLISSPRNVDPRMELLKDIGFPFVVHGRPPESDGVAFLDIDNRDAFLHATRFLIHLGHQRIAMLNGEDRFTFAADRLAGAAGAYAEAGIDPSLLSVDHAPMTVENGYRLARQVLARPDRPTALLCASVLVALGALRAAAELGLDVPRDLSIVAHDDDMPAFQPDHMHPPLTTTRSSIRTAGARVAEIALGRLAGEAPLVQEVWKVDLIVRSSTAPAI